MGAGSVRVLHLINSPQRRGAEVFAAQLASCLQKNEKFENLVCSLYDQGDDELPLREVPLFKLGNRDGVLGRFPVNPALLLRLGGLLKKFQPAVILAHGGDTLKYSASASLFYRKAATVYRNIGTASVWANSSTRVGLNRLLLNRIDAVVSVSQSIKQDFIKVYRLPEEKVTFIPNGVDAAEFEARRMSPARVQVRRELGLYPRDIVLVSVGNLSEEKGHVELLTIMGDLARSGLAINLVIVGDGPLRPQLEQQAQRLELTSQVKFLGRRDDVSRVLAGADIFALPSRTEGMPAVLIEAGMASLPSVAFNVGGVAEVVKDQVTGLLAPSGDLEALSQALTELSGDPQRRAAMGGAARLHCYQEFDINQVTSKYEDLFMRLLGRRERGKTVGLGSADGS